MLATLIMSDELANLTGNTSDKASITTRSIWLSMGPHAAYSRVSVEMTTGARKPLGQIPRGLTGYTTTGHRFYVFINVGPPDYHSCFLFLT